MEHGIECGTDIPLTLVRMQSTWERSSTGEDDSALETLQGITEGVECP